MSDYKDDTCAFAIGCFMGAIVSIVAVLFMQDMSDYRKYKHNNIVEYGGGHYKITKLKVEYKELDEK